MNSVWPPFTGTLRDLARYVSSDAVSRMGLGDREARLRQKSFDRRTAHTAIARHLYENVAARGIPYDHEPYVVASDHPQIIRHPEQLDIDAGTCIDFAILYASLCLAEQLAPLLVIGSEGLAHNPQHHAFVAIDLHAVAGEAGEDGSRIMESVELGNGAAELSYDRIRDDLGSGRFLVVDPTRAARWIDGSWTFEQSVEQAVNDLASNAEKLVDPSQTSRRFERLTWIDIVTVQRSEGTYQPPPAERRPVLTRRMPASSQFIDFADRQALRQRLARLTGVVALVGEPGTGKSMLALDTAGPFGWFLNASSVESLRAELAEAEAWQQTGIDSADIGVTDEKDLVAQARARLAGTRVPWVVVLDNANLAGGESPTDLLAQLPPPRREHGQRVIVTSTDRCWEQAERVDHFEILRPVDTAKLGIPAQLLVAGRPLFAAAFTRLAAVSGIDLDDLAAIASNLDPAPSAAEDVLWLCAQGLLDAGAVETLRWSAWATVDDLDLAVLCRAAGVPSGSITTVLESGLVEPIGGERGRMHRLIATAIRDGGAADLSDTGRRVASVLAATDVTLDLEALQAAQAFEESLGPDLTGDAELATELGRIRHGLGTRLEPLVGVKRAVPYFETALPLLPADDHRRRADCLHCSARHVYQFDKEVASLEAALEDVDRCMELRLLAVDDPALTEPARHMARVERERTKALRGLLKVALAAQRHAMAAESSPDHRVVAADVSSLAYEGSQDVDESHRARVEDLGISIGDADELRARFNQGMTGVNLAQLAEDPASAVAALDMAWAAYFEVKEQRELLRPRVRPHLAACYAGLALVAYLRAIGPTVAGTTPENRSRDLREADSLRARSLALREEIEDVDGAETAKSTYLGVKISLARFLLTLDGDKQAKQLAKLRRELLAELAPTELLVGVPPS